MISPSAFSRIAFSNTGTFPNAPLSFKSKVHRDSAKNSAQNTHLSLLTQTLKTLVAPAGSSPSPPLKKKLQTGLSRLGSTCGFKIFSQEWALGSRLGRGLLLSDPVKTPQKHLKTPLLLPLEVSPSRGLGTLPPILPVLRVAPEPPSPKNVANFPKSSKSPASQTLELKP